MLSSLPIIFIGKRSNGGRAAAPASNEDSPWHVERDDTFWMHPSDHKYLYSGEELV